MAPIRLRAYASGHKLCSPLPRFRSTFWGGGISRTMGLLEVIMPPSRWVSLRRPRFTPSLVLAALQVVGSLARVQVPGIGIAPVRHTLDLLGFPTRLPKLTLLSLAHQFIRAALREEASGPRLSPQVLPFGSLREDETGLFKPPAPALFARAPLGHAAPISAAMPSTPVHCGGSTPSGKLAGPPRSQ